MILIIMNLQSVDLMYGLMYHCRRSVEDINRFKCQMYYYVVLFF